MKSNTYLHATFSNFPASFYFPFVARGKLLLSIFLLLQEALASVLWKSKIKLLIQVRMSDEYQYMGSSENIRTNCLSFIADDLLKLIFQSCSLALGWSMIELRLHRIKEISVAASALPPPNSPALVPRGSTLVQTLFLVFKIVPHMLLYLFKQHLNIV